MLSILRRYINTWIVRALFLVLVGTFVLWGVADVVRQMGSSTAVATVDGERIEMPAMQAAFQNQLAQVGRMFGAGFSPTPDIRRSIAEQALDRLISQAALAAQVKRMGLVVTDDAVRDATFTIPAFRGSDGKFSRPVFQQVLQSNGLDEPRFLALVRADLAQRELTEAVRAGTVAPPSLTESIFSYQQEKRVADMVELPFAAVPPPQPPTDAALRRYWENNADSFATPEQRRIKAVVLSARTLAADVDVSDADLQAAWEQRKGALNTPEKRTAEIVIAPDQAHAEALEQQWESGADWVQMQGAAQAAGGSAVELTTATQAEFPDADLGAAVFKAPLNAVSAPVQTPLGWRLARVTDVVPAVSKSFDDIKQQLRMDIATQRAADQVYDHANKVEDALAGGGGLDQLPQGLGLAAVAGTLDAQGMTPEGQPAPIPGDAALRAAMVAAAFQMKIGDPPKLTEVPAPAQAGQPETSSYYAVQVEAITPSATKPFDVVRDQVAAAVREAAVRRVQEGAAARLLTALNGGQSMADAATVAGAQVVRSQPVGRETPPVGVPQQLVAPLFSLKKDEATMVETADGFVVAQLAEVQTPDAKSDPIGYGQVRQALERSIGDDLETTYVQALRARANPVVHHEMLDNLTQP